jgi:CheY-like chemotaxis protein
VDLKSQRAVTWQIDFRAGRKPYGGSILVAKGVGPELNLLVDAVEGAGFRAIVESDGLAVSRRTEAESPDVAVIDMALPRLDGIQVLRQIKGNLVTRPTSVILLAENEERNLQSSLMTMGVRDIIFKPWLPGDIQRRVQCAYQSSRASKRQQQRAFDRVKAQTGPQGLARWPKSTPSLLGASRTGTLNGPVAVRWGARPHDPGPHTRSRTLLRAPLRTTPIAHDVMLSEGGAAPQSKDLLPNAQACVQTNVATVEVSGPSTTSALGGLRSG